jgi:hypothetical protein
MEEHCEDSTLDPRTVVHLGTHSYDRDILGTLGVDLEYTGPACLDRFVSWLDDLHEVDAMSLELIRRVRIVVEIDTNKREIREELDLDAEAGETICELLTRVRDVLERVTT